MEVKEKLVVGPGWWPDTRIQCPTGRQLYDNCDFDGQIQWDQCLVTHCTNKLPFERRSVSQSVLVSGHHMGPATNISFSPQILYSNIWSFLGMGHPFWWEDGSVIYSCKVLLGLVSTITLGSKLRRTWDYILLSHLRLGSLFVASCDSHTHGGGILTLITHNRYQPSSYNSRAAPAENTVVFSCYWLSCKCLAVSREWRLVLTKSKICGNSWLPTA
jgi:hypothetical protein